MEEDERTIKEGRVRSKQWDNYMKQEDVPDCLVKKDSTWKTPEKCRTRYGIIDDPLEMKYLYEYYKKIKNESGNK